MESRDSELPTSGTSIHVPTEVSWYAGVDPFILAQPLYKKTNVP